VAPPGSDLEPAVACAVGQVQVRWVLGGMELNGRTVDMRQFWHGATPPGRCSPLMAEVVRRPQLPLHEQVVLGADPMGVFRLHQPLAAGRSLAHPPVGPAGPARTRVTGTGPAPAPGRSRPGPSGPSGQLKRVRALWMRVRALWMLT